MVTFAQAQEHAERWVNGDMPAYQHREVRVREFDLGFVAWAEDREDGPTSDGGRARLVIARDSGEITLWPGLPVGEVIRRYEEEYGPVAEGAAAAAEVPPRRIDLEATSFLLSPPRWLQDAADRIGVPDRRGEASPGRPDHVPDGPGESGERAGAGAPAAGAGWPGAASGESSAGVPVAYEPTAKEDVAASAPGAPAGGTPWAGTDITMDAGEGDRSVDLPATVFAPPLVSADDDAPPAPGASADARTELLAGGSPLPPTAIAPAVDAPGAPGGAGGPAARPGPKPPGPPGAPRRPGAGDIADADTSRAPRGGGGGTPPPPGAPGTPGARPGSVGTPPASGPGAPGAPAGGYVPTQLIPQHGSGGPGEPGAQDAPAAPGVPVPGAPGVPHRPGGPGDGMHHAATMLADPSGGPGGPGGPQPPGPPGTPGAPQPTGGSAAPVAPGGAHQVPTMMASGPGVPPVPGPGGPGMTAPPGAQPPGPPGVPGAPQPPGIPGAPQPPGPPGLSGAPGGLPGMPPGAQPPGMPGAPQPPGAPGGYGYPQPPPGQPMVGPGYMAVLRYRAHDGSEQQIIRRSAPGTPHPEWQILHELRAMNVPPQQVLELHTELESCELPGGYCARMIRETWPQVRISHTAGYGLDHTARQQGVRHLIEHQGELHQVADGPARPAPNRAPLPPPHQIQRVPPIPPEGVAHELLQSFGPQGIFRFDQRAVSRQGVPEIVAQTLVWAGLPVDFGPFFWVHAQPGRPVPTLAELAVERGVQPASDAGSYLVMGNDFGRQLCVQYGTAHIVAVPLEGGPGGQPVPPQFVNTGLPEFVRCMALLGRMWRLRYGLNPEQAGRWTVDFQIQLASLDPAALASPEHWWAVLLEQMWDGLF